MFDRNRASVEDLQGLIEDQPLGVIIGNAGRRLEQERIRTGSWLAVCDVRIVGARVVYQLYSIRGFCRGICLN